MTKRSNEEIVRDALQWAREPHYEQALAAFEALVEQQAKGSVLHEAEIRDLVEQLEALDAERFEAQTRVVKLEAALNKAGDRLMQVQPAIDVDCDWALNIVPEAQTEIATALVVSSGGPEQQTDETCFHGIRLDRSCFKCEPNFGMPMRSGGPGETPK